MEKKVMVDNLFEEMKTKLSDYKECIDNCKKQYYSCIESCWNSGSAKEKEECENNCREKLENCIRSCPSDITSKDEEILSEYLNKIEAILTNEN